MHVHTHTHTYLGPQNDASSSLCYSSMKFTHLGNREVAAYVGVEHKERSWIASKDLISEVIYTPGSPQRAVLL